MQLLDFIRKNKDAQRMENMARAIAELKAMPVETVVKYHEVTHYADNNEAHIRELAAIGANEHFRSFLYFERERIVERLENLTPDEADLRAGLCGALKQMAIITREFERKIMEHAARAAA